jgi:hypothetical protein
MRGAPQVVMVRDQVIVPYDELLAGPGAGQFGAPASARSVPGLLWSAAYHSGVMR